MRLFWRFLLAKYLLPLEMDRPADAVLLDRLTHFSLAISRSKHAEIYHVTFLEIQDQLTKETEGLLGMFPSVSLSTLLGDTAG